MAHLPSPLSHLSSPFLSLFSVSSLLSYSFHHGTTYHTQPEQGSSGWSGAWPGRGSRSRGRSRAWTGRGSSSSSLQWPSPPAHSTAPSAYREQLEACQMEALHGALASIARSLAANDKAEADDHAQPPPSFPVRHQYLGLCPRPALETVWLSAPSCAACMTAWTRATRGPSRRSATTTPRRSRALPASKRGDARGRGAAAGCRFEQRSCCRMQPCSHVCRPSCCSWPWRTWWPELLPAGDGVYNAWNGAEREGCEELLLTRGVRQAQPLLPCRRRGRRAQATSSSRPTATTPSRS
ncbi:uncharacterized protein [Triticum aestivum]|uniref:uncharacterized protein n=1 Tax=Triticum aestivum TaxID=4565 RepID=UPI001D02BE34|nr:uncharacterized protein LOC123146329 [Triticum aestivum]